MDWGYTVSILESTGHFSTHQGLLFLPFVQGTTFDQNLLPQTSLDTESLNTIYHLQDLAT